MMPRDYLVAVAFALAAGGAAAAYLALLHVLSSPRRAMGRAAAGLWPLARWAAVVAFLAWLCHVTYLFFSGH